jgi:hypothetical protein
LIADWPKDNNDNKNQRLLIRDLWFFVGQKLSEILTKRSSGMHNVFNGTGNFIYNKENTMPA